MPGCIESADLLKTRRQRIRPSPEPHALCPGRGDALCLPLVDEFTLCLRDLGQNLQHEVRNERPGQIAAPLLSFLFYIVFIIIEIQQEGNDYFILKSY